jgi:GT2 family glycosyltransferase
LRRALGLAGDLPPGFMPRTGHGRSVGFIPPDGSDYPIEFGVGCALNWRRSILEKEGFSPFFEGYGLYEDLDFCIRASRRAPLYFCTLARTAHYHATAGRPRSFHYGKMVVRNGWYVWRLRWPSPRRSDRLRWWCTTFLLLVCRLVDFRSARRTDGVLEGAGRIAGAVSLLMNPPVHHLTDSCQKPKRGRPATGSSQD